jgi:hypothetical protein
MRFSVCLALLAAGCAFALDVDSLPVWNPDYLVRGNAPLTPTDTTDVSHSKLVTHGYKTMQVTVGEWRYAGGSGNAAEYSGLT